MTNTTERYRAAASQSASTVEKIADFWTQGSQKLTDYMPAGLPQVDLVPIVERYFEFVQRTVDISRDLTIKWAESAGMLSGAVREQAESVGGLVREQAEQAEKELAREARKAEREQGRHAHDKARERYEGLTKAELSDQLGQRDLPKTGNVDELVERLVGHFCAGEQLLEREIPVAGLHPVKRRRHHLPQQPYSWRRHTTGSRRRRRLQYRTQLWVRPRLHLSWP